jgi:beta-lactamase class A
MNRLLIILDVCVLSGCGWIVSEQAVPIEPVSAVSPTPTPAAERIDHELEAQLRQIVSEVDGTIGVGAFHIETGDAAYLERHGEFPMMSVYKLPIAMAVLQRIDKGRYTLEQEVAITPEDFVRPGFHSPIRNVNPGGTVMPMNEVLRYSISESDGTANDVLLDAAGGPPAAQEYLNFIGVGDEMIVADSEKSISKDWETQYRNWASPDASIRLLRAIQERRAGLSERMTLFLLHIMTESETGRRRLKKGLPKEASLAHKTGTGGTKDGVTGATNDIGIITLPNGNHVAIAVYVKDSRADMWSRENVMAKIAEAVYARWANR